jgi:hypothetical protein
MLPEFKGKFLPPFGRSNGKLASFFRWKRVYQYSKPIPPVKARTSNKKKTKYGLQRMGSSTTVSGVNVHTLENTPKYQRDGPIVDTEISNVISLNSSLKVNKEIIHKVSTVEFVPRPKINAPGAYELRLSICSEIFDFTDPDANVAEKLQKTQTLCEIVDLVENTDEAKKLTEDQIKMTLEMIETNIIRRPPAIQFSSFLMDRGVSFIEPAWEHLIYVYRILNKLLAAFPTCCLFDMDLFKKIIALTDIPDYSERQQVLTFMKLFYDSHLNKQLEILILVKNKLLSFTMGNDERPPFCVSPLLSFLNHVFIKSNKQPHFEFYNIVRTAVFPLISSSYLPLFNNFITNLFNTIISEGTPVIEYLHQNLIRLWPISNGEKQAYFIDFHILCLRKMNDKQVTNALKQSLGLFADVLNGEQADAIEAVLNFLNSEKPEWVVTHSSRVINELYRPVKDLTIKHWSCIIREKAATAIMELGKLDRNAFIIVCQKDVPDRTKKNLVSAKKSMKDWQRIVKTVKLPEFDRKSLVSSIKELYTPK